MVVFLMACIAGCTSFNEWLEYFGVRNAPVVIGEVVNRNVCKHEGIPSLDLEIEIPGGGLHVHAIVGKKIGEIVPGIVRFHYSGDPSQNVFLFDYEDNPLWIWIFCWSTAMLFLTLLIFKSRKNSEAAPKTDSTG